MPVNPYDVMEGGAAAVDLAEVASGEIPLLGSLFHAAKGAFHLGAAGIDSLFGDDRGARGHLAHAAGDAWGIIPGIGPLIGTMHEDALHHRYVEGHGEGGSDDPMAGGYTETTIDRDAELAALQHEVDTITMHGENPDPALVQRLRQHQRERGLPLEPLREGPEHDPDDVEAIRAMQQMVYEAELREWKAKGGHPQDWPGPRPDTVDAMRKSETFGGEMLATGYELIAPFLGLFDE